MWVIYRTGSKYCTKYSSKLEADIACNIINHEYYEYCKKWKEYSAVGSYSDLPENELLFLMTNRAYKVLTLSEFEEILINNQ